MKRAYVKCPYCGAQAMLRPAHVVHGDQAKQGQYLYVCNRYPKCDAYVGVQLIAACEEVEANHRRAA